MQSHRSPLFKMKVNLGNILGNPTSITKYHRLHGLNNRNGKQKYSHLSGGQKFKIRLHGWVLKRVLFPVSRWLSSHYVFTWPFLNVRLVLKKRQLFLFSSDQQFHSVRTPTFHYFLETLYPNIGTWSLELQFRRTHSVHSRQLLFS